MTRTNGWKLWCLALLLGGWSLAAPANVWTADGWNAWRIEYSRGGQRFGEFRRHEDGRWVEERGGRQYWFEEQRRDARNVWLYDRSRNLTIQLDIGRKQIWYREGNADSRLLYDMWAAHGGGGGIDAPEYAGGDRFACARALQDRIAWDYQGNTHWERSNIRDLCGGAGDTEEPARCFERVMHGGVNWGEGRNWEWPNAIALCAGTRDARATVSCFRGQIRDGYHWQDAIAHCSVR